MLQRTISAAVRIELLEELADFLLADSAEELGCEGETERQGEGERGEGVRGEERRGREKCACVAGKDMHG